MKTTNSLWILLVVLLSTKFFDCKGEEEQKSEDEKRREEKNCIEEVNAERNTQLQICDEKIGKLEQQIGFKEYLWRENNFKMEENRQRYIAHVENLENDKKQLINTQHDIVVVIIALSITITIFAIVLFVFYIFIWRTWKSIRYQRWNKKTDDEHFMERTTLKPNQQPDNVVNN